MDNKEPWQLFDDVIDQHIAISLLNAALEKKQIAPAYLFTGPSGVGRSLTARRFIEGVITGGAPVIRERNRIEALNHPDLIWIEPTYLHQGNLINQSIAIKENLNRRTSPQLRLEQIKGVKKFLSKKPLETSIGIVVIESVEMMNEAAANALLKTLEEPGNGLLILISERPERLLQTIRSRCQRIPFSRLNKASLEKVLSQKEIDQNIESSLQLNQKELITLSNGSPGALIANIKTWQEFPKDIWERLETLPEEPIKSLALARDLTEQFDVEQQLWLINWLQQNLWGQHNDSRPIKRLEVLRSQLTSFVQPRLAWEVALLSIANEKY